jgi:hypothetical protein
VLPQGVEPLEKETISVKSIMSVEPFNRIVTLRNIMLLEFSRSQHLNELELRVTKSDANPNIILGNKYLVSLGIDCCGSMCGIKWLDHVVPYREYVPTFDPETHLLALLLDAAETAVDSDPFDDTFQCYAALIAEQKYEYVDTDQVAENQKHLTPEQRSQLADVLKRFQQLFSGNLGCYPHRKLHLDLLPDATPVRKRPYTVAHAHQEVFKRNLDCLCSLGVLERTGASEWGAPTFVIPKKDGRVRWVSNFRELNKLIKRKVYPLPNIMDILRKHSGYQYFTKLDISMQYYPFELDEESKDLCTIVTPYGNYRYNRLPMGVK